MYIYIYMYVRLYDVWTYVSLCCVIVSVGCIAGLCVLWYWFLTYDKAGRTGCPVGLVFLVKYHVVDLGG